MKRMTINVSMILVSLLSSQSAFADDLAMSVQLRIQANENEGFLSITSQEKLVVTVDAVSVEGNNNTAILDWWLLASTPNGLSSYSMEDGNFQGGISLLSQEGLLMNGEPLVVLQTSDLIPGDYYFHFGVDPDANGALDTSARFESMHVHVTDINCVIRYQSDFSVDEDGWTGGFADYPISVLPEDWNMSFDYEHLPASLSVDVNGLKLQGNNHSDDLFMYAKRLFGKLCPNAVYKTIFHVELASNAATGSFGVGGSPGDSVYVKAGVSAIEPNAVPDKYDYWRMNIDKGNQSRSGKEAVTIGTVGVDLLGPGLGLEYKLKSLSNAENPLYVKADSQGFVWLLVGIDSGFESLTRMYLVDIEVELVPIGQQQEMPIKLERSAS
jgi:hypothetical protein